MSQQGEELDEIQDAQITTIDSDLAYDGDVIRGGDGPVLKIDPTRTDLQLKLVGLLKDGEQPVAIWARLTDTVSGQIVQEGQELMARIRVKCSDGHFMVKAASLSLGVIAAVFVTKRAVKYHHTPR